MDGQPERWQQKRRYVRHAEEKENFKGKQQMNDLPQRMSIGGGGGGKATRWEKKITSGNLRGRKHKRSHYRGGQSERVT